MTKFGKALRQAKYDTALGKNAASLVEQTLGAIGPVRAARTPETDGPVPATRSVKPASGASEAAGAADISDDHLVSLVSPAAFEAEQYRALRHVVEEMHKTANVKVVAISSPAVGDGKTTTAINLAGALAQSPEARVLLVDADLRRPAIGMLLDRVDATPGLVDAILDPALDLEQVLEIRPQFNLSFIHAGRALPSNPYELLTSPRLANLLEESRRRFDYVVLDTPPLSAVQDCRLIARWVDGFLVVVAANRTPRRLVEEALAVIEPAKIIGLVFNGDTSPPVSYHGYAGNYLRTPP